jgi:hypothetical protein
MNETTVSCTTLAEAVVMKLAFRIQSQNLIDLLEK